MEKHQGFNKQMPGIYICFLGVIIVLVVALGCYFYFTRSAEGKHEQRAGEVHVIGDEVVYKGYQGSGEVLCN